MGDITMMEHMDGIIEDKGIRIFDEQLAEEPDYYPFCDFFIEAIQDSFWTHRLYTFQSDVQDFRIHMTEEERDVVIRNLSNIGQLEISVKKFWAKIGDNLPHPNIINAGYVMASNEVVHGKAYKHLFKVLGIKGTFEEILKLDIVKGRVAYLTKHLRKFHTDNKKQFIYSLILFTLIIENIALFAPFYTISWFNKTKNFLKDTNKQVQYTSREETLHCNFGITLINTIRKEYPELFDKELEEKVLKEAEQSIKYECQMIEWMLGGYEGVGYDGERLDVDCLSHFIKNRLNISLKDIGYSAIFEVDQDILQSTKWFNEQLIAPNKSDFFQERPSEYSVGNHSFDEESLFT